MAGEYWFTPEQLAEMARPTMDSALEALEAQDYEKVAALCESMKHEWRFLHDLMAESLLALLTYIGEQFGEERVGDALRYMTTRVWRPTVEKIMQMSRRAQLWRSALRCHPRPNGFDSGRGSRTCAVSRNLFHARSRPQDRGASYPV